MLAIQDLVDIRTEVRERSQESFKSFIRFAWDVIEPGTRFLPNWHIDAIADHLEAVYRGEINRFVCNIAPGHMKSTIFSVMFPCWMWIKIPTTRWLCASHSLDLAIRDNRNCRSLIESEWFQSCFGDIFQLSGDQNVKSFFENNHRGYRMALSVGSKGGTGKRGTHLLIDDPNNATAGEADIEKTIRWFGNTWMSRINSYETGAMIVVGQRLHELDLTGHILSLGGWEHLVLPTEYEPARRCFTSIGFGDKRTKEGELLWPEKFPPKVINTLKHSLGSLAYAAQFQQSPVPSTGGIFKQEWKRYFEIEGEHYILHTKYGRRKPVPIHACRNEAVCDLAVSEKEQADYFVIQTWAITPENECLLLHQLRGHFNNPDQQKKAIELYERFRWERFHVEKVAYQLAYIQQMRNYEVREEVEKGVYRVTKVVCMPVCPWTPFRDKVARAGVAAVKMEAGDMYWLANAPYLSELEPEIFTFPKSKKKDQVDCHSMIADILSAMGGPAVWSLDEGKDEEKSEKSSMVSGASQFEEEEMEEWEE